MNEVNKSYKKLIYRFKIQNIYKIKQRFIKYQIIMNQNFQQYILINLII